MEIFQKNIEALKSVDQNLAKLISNIDTNKTYEVFVSDRLENANILDTRDNLPLYIQEPIKEINKTLKDFEEYKLYKSLYFYGIGNGYLYKKLLENSIYESIYIIEPELELIYVALNLIDLSKEIASKRLILIESKKAQSAYLTSIIKGVHKIYFKAYNLHLHSDYYEKYIEDIKKVNQEITKVFSYTIKSTGNDTTDELLGLDHFLENLPTMIKNASLKELTKKAKLTNSAIIVATGPSLAKQLPLLKKIQEYVTIISVDASLPILEREGIKPDIVTSIERIALTGKFYEKTSKEFQKDIVFAITAIADKKLLNNIKAGQLQLSMRPTGTHYYYMKLDDWGYIGLGMSAANMAYELASKIEFENIILIGQDLAYGKDGSSHSKNHIFGEDEIKHNSEKDDYIEAYGGGQVKTTWVWKLFLSGYENTILENNKKGKIRTINSTEGGARINGTVEMPFSEVLDKYIDNSTKKAKIILQKPSQEEIITNIKDIHEKLTHVYGIGYNMHRSTKRLLKEITQTINRYKKHDIDNIHNHIKERESKKLVDKISKLRNKYYGGEFESFYGFLISPLITHLEYDIAYLSIQKNQTQKERIQKNWKMILFHHEWCYRVMINIEAILKIMNEKIPLLEEKVGNEMETA